MPGCRTSRPVLLSTLKEQTLCESIFAQSTKVSLPSPPVVAVASVKARGTSPPDRRVVIDSVVNVINVTTMMECRRAAAESARTGRDGANLQPPHDCQPSARPQARRSFQPPAHSVGTRARGHRWHEKSPCPPSTKGTRAVVCAPESGCRRTDRSRTPRGNGA